MRKIGHKDVLAPFPAKQMISTFGNHSVVHTIVNNILMVYTDRSRRFFWFSRISVTFVDKDGTEKTIKVPVGMSMLEAAHQNDIELEGFSEFSFFLLLSYIFKCSSSVLFTWLYRGL